MIGCWIIKLIVMETSTYLIAFNNYIIGLASPILSYEVPPLIVSALIRYITCGPNSSESCFINAERILDDRKLFCSYIHHFSNVWIPLLHTPHPRAWRTVHTTYYPTILSSFDGMVTLTEIMGKLTNGRGISFSLESEPVIASGQSRTSGVRCWIIIK